MDDVCRRRALRKFEGSAKLDLFYFIEIFISRFILDSQEKVGENILKETVKQLLVYLLHEMPRYCYPIKIFV